MSVQDDMLWVRDALDGITSGALPRWPREWSTKLGSRIAAGLQALIAQRNELWSREAHLKEQVAKLLTDNSGLRDANQRLTDDLLRLENQR